MDSSSLIISWLYRFVSAISPFDISLEPFFAGVEFSQWREERWYAYIAVATGRQSLHRYRNSGRCDAMYEWRKTSSLLFSQGPTFDIEVDSARAEIARHPNRLKSVDWNYTGKFAG